MSSHKVAPVIPDPKGYESADIDLAPIIKWMVILEIFVLVSTLITYPIYLFFLPKTTVGDVTRFTDRRLPPEPKLQALPKIEMKDFRLDEQEKVEGYGWAEREKGAVRIPIEKAMQMVEEKGADGLNTGSAPVETPKPTSTAPDTAKPTTEPTAKPAEPKPTETKPETSTAPAPDTKTAETKPAETGKKAGE